MTKCVKCENEATTTMRTSTSEYPICEKHDFQLLIWLCLKEVQNNEMPQV